jgi:signal transduction histidine kinase
MRCSTFEDRGTLAKLLGALAVDPMRLQQILLNFASNACDRSRIPVFASSGSRRPSGRLRLLLPERSMAMGS